MVMKVSRNVSMSTGRSTVVFSVYFLGVKYEIKQIKDKYTTLQILDVYKGPIVSFNNRRLLTGLSSFIHTLKEPGLTILTYSQFLCISGTV